MRQKIKALQSLVSAMIIKGCYPSSFTLRGIPVCLSKKNIVISNGTLFVGKRISALPNARIVVAGGGKLVIGNGVFFNNNVNCVCRNSVCIEDGCRFGPNVCIYDHDHVFDKNGVTDEYRLGEIYIGKGSWIGANVVVLRGTHIGEGCVIGAGVIVKGDIPPHSLVTAENRKLSINPISK